MVEIDDTEGSSSNTSKSDISNPFFIHHSDHPGLVLVSKPLNGDNYSPWLRAMTIALNAKNKLGFVNGTLKTPSAEKNPNDYATWSRCNDMVHSWIINSIAPEISDSVIYYTTAREVWEDLRERFSQSNAPRIFEIQREIAYHRQDQLPVSAYYTKLKSLWDELSSHTDASSCTCGAQHDRQRLMQFLMGLNESYSAARGQILLMNPLPSVRQAYAAICQEEKQRHLGTAHATDSSTSAAMAVRNNRFNQTPRSSKPERSDRFTGSQDGRRNDPDQRRSGSYKGRPSCSYCGDMGHLMETCWKLIGYPPGHPKERLNKSKNEGNRNRNFAANQVSVGLTKDDIKSVVSGVSEAQLQQLISILSSKDGGTNIQANAAITKPKTPPGLSKISFNRWIIDSGATDHIASSPKLFLHGAKNCSLPPVLLPSGERASIVAKGSLPLNNAFYLHDVLCVPTFKVDLMSVSRLTRGLQCSVTFFPYWCVLQDLVTKKMIGLGKERNGLYYLVALATKKTLTNPTSNSANQPTCNLVTSSTDLWHYRLGHVSLSRLNFIAKNFLNISINSNNACHICHLAKQSRLPFGISSISSEKPFDLIHCDVWGRYKHPSLSGAHYFLTIVDDYTRFTWVFLMRHKDETQSLLKHFFSYVSTQFSSCIKAFRSDNGSEFLSLQSFFKDNGVVFQHSCVYTPQQNGVVERKHRHILQVARALKFHAHLPTHFWGECVLSAVHIINRLPTPLLSFKTPFERLYNKLPSFSHLRTIGCLAYATNPRVAHKFSPRAIKCVFIGYPVGQKAYKLFELSTRRVFTSRDVIFHENVFPYAHDEPSFVPPSLGMTSGPIPNTISDPAPFDSPCIESAPIPDTANESNLAPISPNLDDTNLAPPTPSAPAALPPPLPSPLPPAPSPEPIESSPSPPPSPAPLRRSDRATAPPVRL